MTNAKAREVKGNNLTLTTARHLLNKQALQGS